MGKAKEGKRTKKERDPNAPKRPLTAYFLFANEMRDKVKSEKPDLKVTEVASECGARWKKLSEKEKKVYQDKHDRLKDAYTKELAAYNAKKNQA